ncbi:hypothetical protein HMPREF9957_1596 [Streptococcus mitis SK1080]|uniref:Uncharacterized protein n=1 Tax=Streptococcus mitis SK1080 TaxID=1008453 RepID=F9HKP2_STRMT|nr:hypothetical protein HMPREF9957_1596 [Streptococcus mitis SK1080]
MLTWLTKEREIMDKKEFIAFNNRFNRFILAFEKLKKINIKVVLTNPLR